MSTHEKRYPSLAHWGAFTAVVRDNRLVACEPFDRDPAPSAILESMPETVHSSLRVARPAVRRDWLNKREASDRSLRGKQPFVEVSWNRALQLVAEEIARVRNDYGHEAIFGGSYGWSSAGRLHHARTLTHRFLHSGGGCTNQVGNYSWGAAQFILPHVVGDHRSVTGVVTDWNSIAENTGLMLAFGGLPLRNTQVTSGGAGEHSTDKWLRHATNQGMKMVVVSPQRSDVPAGIDARWIPIRPNTDTALMLAMIHALLADGRHDAQFLNRYCVGFEAFADYLQGKIDGQAKDCHWAAAICDVPAGMIRELALAAANTRTMLTCAWALQRAHHGEQPYWACIALAAALGQIGLPGGGFAFGHASMNAVGNPRRPLAAPTRAVGPNPINRAIPAARLTDMLLNPGAPFEFNGKHETYPDIRLVYWGGGNPFHHQQDLNRLARAWQRPETIIVHENFWTATARRADIVLPATVALERNDIGGSSHDRFVLAMQQALRPYGYSRNDFDIYRELAAMAGHEQAFSEGRNEAEWIRHIYATMAKQWADAGYTAPAFADFWAQGYAEVPAPDERFVLFEPFRRNPDQHPLNTPSGKIELFSSTIAGFGYAECPPHPSWLPPAEWAGAPQARQWPLHLLSFQPADKLHSQMDAGRVSTANKPKGRSQLFMNPEDAHRRDIGQHDNIRVFNARGSCLATAVVTDALMPGVVSMPTGAWFDPVDDTLERHGNPNVLTRDMGTSRLSQGPSAQTALVEVQRWTQPLPDITVFDGPELVNERA